MKKFLILAMLLLLLACNEPPQLEGTITQNGTKVSIKQLTESSSLKVQNIPLKYASVEIKQPFQGAFTNINGTAKVVAGSLVGVRAKIDPKSLTGNDQLRDSLPDHNIIVHSKKIARSRYGEEVVGTITYNNVTKEYTLPATISKTAVDAYITINPSDFKIENADAEVDIYFSVAI